MRGHGTLGADGTLGGDGAQVDFVAALRRDLRRTRPGEHVALGTVCEPYPPAEHSERVTARALAALLRADGLRVSITTRSALVARDAKLLARLSERHAIHVNIAFTTPDVRLARFLEPRAPSPEERLAALRSLRAAGVETGVFLMPLLPGVSDADQDLDALIAAAAAADAGWLGARVICLQEPTRRHFLRALRQSYPRVAARYAWWTSSHNAACGGRADSGRTRGTGAGGDSTRSHGRGGRRGELPANVRAEALDRVRSLAARHGLPTRRDLGLPAPPTAPRRQATFSFAGDAQ